MVMLHTLYYTLLYIQFGIRLHSLVVSIYVLKSVQFVKKTKQTGLSKYRGIKSKVNIVHLSLCTK